MGLFSRDTAWCGGGVLLVTKNNQVFVMTCDSKNRSHSEVIDAAIPKSLMFFRWINVKFLCMVGSFVPKSHQLYLLSLHEKGSFFQC